jgi:hypothetical protein
MKKILLAVLLTLLRISAIAEPTAKELMMSKWLSGESMAFIMATMDEAMLKDLESSFRSKLKHLEQNVAMRTTDTQKSNIHRIVKDIYYTKIRPILRESFSSMNHEELYLIASAIASGDENHKGYMLIGEVLLDIHWESMKIVDGYVIQFSFGCDFSNNPPSQDADK